MSTIYIHWPYCVSKCFYCDFNSIACLSQIDWKVWYAAYTRVLSKFADEYYSGEKITSVYFGGGTPSLMDERLISGILEYIAKRFNVNHQAEITLEANPKTLGVDKAWALKAAGVNRMSIGVQSLKDFDLRMLGRIHTSQEAVNCVVQLADIFQNLSIDLIYNRPFQVLEDWEEELAQACKLPVTHLSLYELIVEEKTPLHKMIESGALIRPSQGAEFLDKTIEVARQNGFEIYEVSNYVKNNTEFFGRHNLSYWRYEDFFGVGPGAHSRVSIGQDKLAIESINNPNEWLLWTEEPEFCVYKLSKEEEYIERLLMGLRTRFGMLKSDLDEVIRTKTHFERKLKKLIESGYAYENGDHFCLTHEGMVRLNMIEEYFYT